MKTGEQEGMLVAGGGGELDGLIAVAIIRTWKTNSKVRKTFRSLAAFAAYVENKGSEGLALVGLS